MPKRKAPARRHSPRPSTALTRYVPPPRPARVKPLRPTPDAFPALSDDIALGALGHVAIKLKAEEELALSEPVNVADIQIKPTGQPYLSHPAYTRWFNRAFGRLGWSIVPCAKAMRMSDAVVVVVVPYVLYIHGQPAVFANGEQEYHESNKEQTYGDVLEATVASALRRCAKRLGVGLELWDKKFLAKFKEEHCVYVQVNGKYGIDRKWRRRDDPPLTGEIKPEERPTFGARAEDADVREEARRPPARTAQHNYVGKPITDKQRRRLWTIASHAGRDHNVVKEWLRTRYGLETSKAITIGPMYDEICRIVEGRGELPLREPGDEA